MEWQIHVDPTINKETLFKRCMKIWNLSNSEERAVAKLWRVRCMKLWNFLLDDFDCSSINESLLSLTPKSSSTWHWWRRLSLFRFSVSLHSNLSQTWSLITPRWFLTLHAQERSTVNSRTCYLYSTVSGRTVDRLSSLWRLNREKFLFKKISLPKNVQSSTAEHYCTVQLSVDEQYMNCSASDGRTMR